MTQTSHELANFFVEASKALEELPHVKSKLAEVEESLAIQRDITHGKESRIDDLMVKQNELEAKIFALQHERDAAEFAALEAKDTAEKLIASIRDVMKGAAAADAILNPTPAVPEASPVTSETGASNGSAPEHSLAPQVQSSGSESSGQSTLGSQDSSSEAASASQTVIVGDRPLSTVDSMDTAPQENVHSTSASAGESPTAKPYDGEAYWLKPDRVTWQEWVDGGGEKAPYVTDADMTRNY